jgi:alkylated DNA nucleotide flippase Atl1
LRNSKTEGRKEKLEVKLARTYRKKTWQEKLADKKGLPKVMELEERFPCYNAVHKMGAEAGDPVVLVNPSEVVEVMKDVPEGKLITIVEICKILAKKHGVRACCSLTTGIFIMTAANAVEEATHEGTDMDIPYWRTLKADGFLNEKYPGGAEAQKRRLEKERFVIHQKGKRHLVENYRDYLVNLHEHK